MSMRIAHSDDTLDDVHEINVTPFIDVMLVLLIIFMVTAPLVTVSVPVDLPVAKSNPPPQQAEPVYVTLQADMSISVGDNRVHSADFAAAINHASKGNHDARILLRADRKVDYGHLMAMMNLLRDAGYLKVALIGLEPGEVQGTELN